MKVNPKGKCGNEANTEEKRGDNYKKKSAEGKTFAPGKVLLPANSSVRKQTENLGNSQ